MIALLDGTRFRVKANGCWVPKKTGTTKGYRQMQFGGKTMVAHRVAYMLQVGPIPDGYEVDHLCHNTGCINPAHLEAVTQEENLRRRDEHNGIGEYRTHCPYGHEMSGDNLYVWTGSRTDTKNGQLRTHRRCRTCMRSASDAYRRIAAANREAADSVRNVA